MKKIKSPLFSLAIIRALFWNTVFIKIDGSYYAFFTKTREFSWNIQKFCQTAGEIQGVYLPSGKQEFSLIRCVNENCNNIINFNDGSYVETYASSKDINLNYYQCRCCKQEQYFLNRDGKGTTQYLGIKKSQGKFILSPDFDEYISNSAMYCS